MYRYVLAVIGLTILISVQVMLDHHASSLQLKRDVLHRSVHTYKTDWLWGEDAAWYVASHTCSASDINIPIVSSLFRERCLQKEIDELSSTLYQLTEASYCSCTFKMLVITIVGM
ncbi:hypothetical protein OTU49_001976 [Cherax quadricarinatus]|uniref:Uncharacterized protein n=1 Tax=Cherax quadricarinatus TaxID=27406 RepID=A0AAW0XDL1_CHEQU